MIEEYHEFPRGYTNIFINNMNNTKDYTYSNLKVLIKNKDLCVLSGDKDSCIIIMNKQNNVKKLEDMLNELIKRETYKRPTDTTKQDKKLFKASYAKTSKISLARTT